LAYGEYSNKKLSILNGIGSSRKGVKMWKITWEMGSQNKKGRCKCGPSTKFSVLKSQRLWKLIASESSI
jgi:hypothetical protein